MPFAGFGRGLQNVSNLTNRLASTATAAGIPVGNIQTGVQNLTSGRNISILPAGLQPAANIANQFASISANFDRLESSFNPRGSTTEVVLNNQVQTYDERGRLKNPLRDYATYNYIVEMGCLSPAEVNAPYSGYRDAGLPSMIMRSGGGNLGKRVQTYAEGPDHAEYYIEGLEVEAVIAPNSRTGVANGTNINFEIIEPYSMGQFLESLQIAAMESQYVNYINACFCLKVSFVGQRDNEGPSSLPIIPKFFPIKMLKVEMNVSGEGCRYACQAIPWNEQANDATLTETQVDTNIRGSTIHQMLEAGETALTRTLNARGEARENRNLDANADRFIIAFPTSPTGLCEAAESINRSATSNAFTQRLDQAVNNTIAMGGASRLYTALKGYADTNVNEIGRSKIVLNTQEDRNPRMGDPSEAGEGATITRNTPSMQIDGDEGVAQYPQGSDISTIIEDVLKYSEYGNRFATEEPSNGKKKWYKVETYTFVDPNVVQELQSGEQAKVYVYAVVPYFVDEHLTSAPSKVPNNIQGLSALAVKEYNYLYTGLNEDILNFDIDFKMNFFQNVAEDFGQLSGANGPGGTMTNPRVPEPTITRQDPNTGAVADFIGRSTASGNRVAGAGERVARAGDRFANLEPLATERSVRPSRTSSSGFRQSLGRATKARIAEVFHDNIINGDADMINVEMEIWGDPYYIPTSGMGNYISSNSTNRPNVNDDGTMNYSNTEVHIVINFRTPIDYNPARGTMDFSDKQQMFSGLYRVLSVVNKFSEGKFTQTLKCVRIPRQTGEPTTGQNSVKETTNTSQNMNTRLQGIVGQSGSGIGAQGTPLDSGRQEVLQPTGSAPGGTAQLNSNRPGVAPPSGTGNGALGTITTSKRGLSAQVAASLVENFQGLIDELENDLGYEIYSIGGYNYRYISGTQTLSWHAGGVAIDINPSENPYITQRNAQVVTDMPNAPNGSLMVALAEKYGLGWGGAWSSSKDAMHFSAARNEGGSLDVQRGQIP